MSVAIFSIRFIIKLKGPISQIYLDFGADFKNHNVFSSEQIFALLFNHLFNFDLLQCQDQCFQLELSSIRGVEFVRSTTPLMLGGGDGAIFSNPLGSPLKSCSVLGILKTPFNSF